MALVFVESVALRIEFTHRAIPLKPSVYLGIPNLWVDFLRVGRLHTNRSVYMGVGRLHAGWVDLTPEHRVGLKLGGFDRPPCTGEREREHGPSRALRRQG